VEKAKIHVEISKNFYVIRYVSNTLGTVDADLRFTLQLCKTEDANLRLTRDCFPCTKHLIKQYI